MVGETASLKLHSLRLPWQSADMSTCRSNWHQRTERRADCGFERSTSLIRGTDSVTVKEEAAAAVEGDDEEGCLGGAAILQILTLPSE